MMATDLDGMIVRERVTIEKVDVSGETPRLIETLILEDGHVVSVQKPERRDGG